MRFVGLLALSALAAIGCGGDDTCLTCDDAGSPDASDARAGDATVDGGSDAADGGADAADGAVDGSIDAGPDLGRPGVAFVAGGAVCTSPKYRMVVSLGQGPGGNETSTSAKYRFQGGVVGATQKP